MLNVITLDQDNILDEFGVNSELNITHHILLQYLVDISVNGSSDVIINNGDIYCCASYDKMKKELPLVFSASTSNRTMSRYIKTLCENNLIYVIHDVHDNNKPYYSFPCNVVAAYCSVRHPDDNK